MLAGRRRQPLNKLDSWSVAHGILNGEVDPHHRSHGLENQSLEIADVLATDAGMLGLWSPTSFREVIDYETWEDALLEDEDVSRHIAAGAFVPVNIGSDGAFQLAARIGSTHEPAELTERERRYLLVSSSSYLFVSTGAAVISGMEHVQADPDVGLKIPLPAGRWSVTVALLDWADEPGSKDDHARPTATALPDFTLLINPEDDPSCAYRTNVLTFDR